MRFTDWRVIWNRRRQVQLAEALILADRGLRFTARWGVPFALAFLILSGPLLPLMGGGLAPYAGLRGLHVLAGLGLGLAVLYRFLAGATDVIRRLVAWMRQNPRRTGASLLRLSPDPARTVLATLHGVLLITVLWTGVERYIGQRWGAVAFPVLSATQWSVAHRLVTPYYVAALLLHWFVKVRIAWRRLIEQGQQP